MVQLPRPVLFLWAATAAMVVVHLLQPFGKAADATYLVPSVAAPVVSWFVVRRAPAGARLVPILLASGLSASGLGDVLCPTMVIRGERSPLLPPGDLEMIEDAVRRVRVEQVPGGHVVLWDALAESSALVRDFLVAKRQTA